MNPKARTESHRLVATPQGDLLMAPQHRLHLLSGLASFIYRQADGTRTVDHLHRQAAQALPGPIKRADVELAMDQLADAQALERRMSPPSGYSRRRFVQGLQGAAALSVLWAALGTTQQAQAAAGGQCADEQALLEEIAFIEAQQTAVAEWLDKALTALENGATPADPFYLAEVAAREAKRKSLAADADERLDDATFDLTTCRVEARTAESEAAFKLRMEERAKQHDALQAHKKKKADEQSKKSAFRIESRESDAKKRISSTEAERKRAFTQEERRKLSESQAKLQMEETVKRKDAGLERLAARVREEEKRKQIQRDEFEQRSEETQKRGDRRLLAIEERQTLAVEALRMRQEEQSVKSVLKTDYAAMVGKEELEKAAVVARNKEEDYKKDRQIKQQK